MIVNGITQEAFITKLEVGLGTNYTQEQKNLISSFGDGPIFCFADPGTGKTYTAIGGLLNAELFKSIPGSNIYALSFTKLATSELAVRHERACQKLGISKQVNFATLHKLCRDILKEKHKMLGMSKFDTTGELTMDKAYRLVEATLAEEGIPLEPNKIRACVMACRKLNAALIFDEDVVTTKADFKDCNVSYDVFDKIRGNLFSYSLLSETISVSDLLLYTVLLLTRHPEISAEFKSKCKLMLVDEAQDLSLLQLRIISLLTDNPILIGDMKQQIYGFNGACQEVVQEFHKLYPNSTDMKLTQSFRCKDEIVKYATKLILPNNIGGEDFKGVGPGGVVNIYRGLSSDGADIHGLAERLHSEFIQNHNRFPTEYLFLVRNNFSITPIIEELYKQGLPFRVNKFMPAYDTPLIKEMCELMNLAQSPHALTNILALRYLIPEFKGYHNILEHPYYKICSQTGCSIFEVNYQFRDPAIAGKAMELLTTVAEMISAESSMKDIINTMWPLFSENYVKQNAWRLEANPKTYFESIEPLVYKSYSAFLQDEIKKAQVIQESEKYSRGVRCYTMHASKGLEADVVYIIDADDGLIPNISKLNKMVSKHCEMDVARAIREERSLCYVACTRAKEELNIVYNESPAPMIMGENPFQDFDRNYECYKVSGDDIRAFESFTERYVPL